MHVRISLLLLATFVGWPMIAQVKPAPTVADEDTNRLAAEQVRSAPKLKVITEASATYLPKFNSSSPTDLVNSTIYEVPDNMTIGSRFVHLRDGSGAGHRLFFQYSADPQNGGDITGQWGELQTFSIGFNSEGAFYGSPPTSGGARTVEGRTLYIYDRYAAKYRTVLDGNGTWWFGTSPANYTFRVLAASTTATGTTIDEEGRLAVGGASDPAYRLKVYGNARFEGTVTGQNIRAHYQDLAEWVPATTDLAPGTVVILNGDRNNEVMASTSSYDTTVAGVVSAQPGISLGIEGEGMEQIATTGRVKVRVDARTQAVRVGDLLVTSDLAGTAMRSEPMAINGRMFHQPGTIIGKALEPLETGIGEILVLLSLQ
jgi:hypothetical protein